MSRLFVALLAWASLSAAEVAWPAVPDSAGLGPRLSTIAWMQDRGVFLPAESTDVEILAWYAEESGLNAKKREVLAQQHAAAYKQWQAEHAASELIRSDLGVEEALINAVASDGPTSPPAVAEPGPRPVAAPRKQQIVVGLENRSEWVANEGHAPVATRGGLTVTVYMKKNNATSYFVMVESLPGASSANLVIDNLAYGPLTLGSTTSLQRMPSLSGVINPSPEVTLQGL